MLADLGASTSGRVETSMFGEAVAGCCIQFHQFPSGTLVISCWDAGFASALRKIQEEQSKAVERLRMYGIEVLHGIC